MSRLHNLDTFREKIGESDLCLTCLLTLNQNLCYFYNINSELLTHGYDSHILSKSSATKHSSLLPKVFQESLATYRFSDRLISEFLNSVPEYLESERDWTIISGTHTSESLAYQRAKALRVIPTSVGLTLGTVRNDFTEASETISKHLKSLDSQVKELRNSIRKISDMEEDIQRLKTKNSELTSGKSSATNSISNANLSKLEKRIAELTPRVGQLETSFLEEKSREPLTPRSMSIGIQERLETEAHNVTSLSVRMDEQARTNQKFNAELERLSRALNPQELVVNRVELPRDNSHPFASKLQLQSPPESPKTEKGLLSKNQVKDLATHLKQSGNYLNANLSKNKTSLDTIDTWEKSTQDSHNEDDDSDTGTVMSYSTNMTESTAYSDNSKVDQKEVDKAIEKYENRNTTSIHSTNLEYWLDFLDEESETFRHPERNARVKTIERIAHDIFKKRIYHKGMSKTFKDALLAKIVEDLSRRLHPKKS